MPSVTRKIRDFRERYSERAADEMHELRNASAKEDLEEKEKEIAEGKQVVGKYRTYYKTDDRGMFIKE
jgi:hypothetical protein